MDDRDLDSAETVPQLRPVGGPPPHDAPEDQEPDPSTAPTEPVGDDAVDPERLAELMDGQDLHGSTVDTNPSQPDPTHQVSRPAPPETAEFSVPPTPERLRRRRRAKASSTKVRFLGGLIILLGLVIAALIYLATQV